MLATLPTGARPGGAAHKDATMTLCHAPRFHAFALQATVLAGLLGLASGGAHAAPPVSGAESLYRQERAACLSGHTSQDRATCLKEASAALAEARRSPRPTDESPGSLRDNALRRCQVFTTTEERERCTRMADGAGTRSGSVSGGGVIKELVTREPAAR
jgi:hypothetical protein